MWPIARTSTRIEMKGGGDAVSAARAVLQTGEFDYAWNLQVEDEILKRMETGGKGRVQIVPGGNIEFIADQFHRSLDRRSTASAPASRPSTRCSPIPRCARR
jgi:ABC-type transport system substrate-binding protein